MIISGSTPFFEKLAMFQWYEVLLARWIHYVPVDRWFRDGNESVPNPWTETEEPSVESGPMGCLTRWLRHILDRNIPFGSK